MSHEVLGSQHVALNENASTHPAVQVMIDRLSSGSRRENRDDEHTVALAIEGGGVAGAVSGGMCVALESSGLIDTVDQIYGTSSGALNGSFTASGQAALGATNYEDIISPQFVSWRHALRGRSIVNFDYLFNDVMRNKEPYDFEGLSRGPNFGALSVNLETLEAEVLKDFEDTEDLMLAVRASCAMPVYSGPPIIYRGFPMTDGALLASVPFRAALDEGATHVLALRSRGESYRKSEYSLLNVKAVRHFGGQALAGLVAGRPTIYNQDAEELQLGASQSVLQIAPAGQETPVEQLEKSLDKIRAGFRLGVMAVGKAFGMPELDVSWEQLPIIVTDPK